MPTINRKIRTPRKRRITATKKEAQSIYQDQRWKDLRILKLQEQPLCERCFERGIIKLAEEVHHIDEWSNYEGYKRTEAAFYCGLKGLMSLCKQCHIEIHKEKHTNKFKC